MNTFLLTIVVVIGISISLLVWLSISSGAFLTREGKILFLVGCFILPVVAMFSIYHLEWKQSETTEFCLSCHTMKRYGESLEIDDDESIPAVHYQNNYVDQKEACYSCHTEYTIFGPFKAKFRGLKHLYNYYFSEEKDEIKLYSPYSNRECLRCHGSAKKYLKSKYHRETKYMLSLINAGDYSCLESDCHDVAHYFEEDDESWDEWDEGENGAKEPDVEGNPNGEGG